MEQPVIIKSSPHGIRLLLDPEIPFEQLKQEIKKKFKHSGKIFKNARVALSFEGRSLDSDEQQQVLEAITENTGIEVVCVMDDDAGYEAFCEQRIKQMDDMRTGRTGEFYRGTLRSGQCVECETSLIVLGDVNPGAKIIAKGNIVVLGSLRGNAYAGASGNENAFIAALDMDPLLLKIGNTYGRSSDRGAYFAMKNRRKTMEPQIATAHEDQIMIEPITQGLLNNI